MRNFPIILYYTIDVLKFSLFTHDQDDAVEEVALKCLDFLMETLPLEELEHYMWFCRITDVVTSAVKAGRLDLILQVQFFINFQIFSHDFSIKFCSTARFCNISNFHIH